MNANHFSDSDLLARIYTAVTGCRAVLILSGGHCHCDPSGTQLGSCSLRKAKR